MMEENTYVGINGTGVLPECNADLIREAFQLGLVDRLGGSVGQSSSASSWRPGSNSGLGENFSLKLTTQDLPDGYSES